MGLFDNVAAQPASAGMNLSMFPPPVGDPNAISRFFAITTAPTRLRTLTERLAENDPSWLIPQTANGAIISNVGPDLLCYNFDEAEGEIGVNGVAYLQPTYQPDAPSAGRASNPTPGFLTITNRASLIRLRLGADGTGAAVVNIVWLS